MEKKEKKDSNFSVAVYVAKKHGHNISDEKLIDVAKKMNLRPSALIKNYKAIVGINEMVSPTKTVKEADIHHEITKSKSQRFLDALLRGEKISSARAYEQFDLFRPAVPIQRFRERGFFIQTEMRERINFNGQLVRYGVYYIRTEDMEYNQTIAKLLK